MKSILFLLLTLSLSYFHSNFSSLNYTYTNTQTSLQEEDHHGLMVPIPKEDRVFNKTGIQCVWASIECLGRFANEKKLIGLTNHEDCQSYASPTTLAAKLKSLKVKFEQTVNKKDKSLLIKSLVEERRGCLFGIPGHAMVLVHYDEQNKFVKYINNSDKNLKVRTWSLDEFNQRWDGWICVVYADNDLIYRRYSDCSIPIVDKNSSQGNYKKDYIIKPFLN